jgi:hypothetical protein
MTSKQKSQVFKPPVRVPASVEIPKTRISIFLAGSIEMGKAEDWQTKVQEYFKEFPIDFYNPRRDEWDSTWKQSIDNEKFSEQVNWEMDMLERADIILMYFDPGTKSPISLLELGLHASSGKVIVVCPNGFWRKGNVDIVCQRYNVPVFDTLKEPLELTKEALVDAINVADAFEIIKGRLN